MWKLCDNGFKCLLFSSHFFLSLCSTRCFRCWHTAAIAALTMCAAMVIYRRKCNKYRMSETIRAMFQFSDHGICMNFFGSKVKHTCGCRFVAAEFIIAPASERTRFYMRILKTNCTYRYFMYVRFAVPVRKMHCAQLMPRHTMSCQRIDLSSFRIILFRCLVNRQVNAFLFFLLSRCEKIKNLNYSEVILSCFSSH